MTGPETRQINGRRRHGQKPGLTITSMSAMRVHLVIGGCVASDW